MAENVQRKTFLSMASVLTALFFVIGLGILTGAYLCYESSRSRSEDYPAARGKVVSLKVSHGGEGGRTYSPVVTFSTAEGQEVTFVSQVGSDPASHDVGEEVVVFLFSRRSRGCCN